jgi:PhzF family phenazine biosynthesis protein
MGQRIVTVDAFTARPFAGNPAAVCVLAAPADPRWMQDVAREMNYAETAFLNKRDDGFGLRWFSPATEIALCGHATLASAHVLWEDRHLTAGAQARFHTMSGLLTADARGDLIELDFPAVPARAEPAPAGLLEGLGVTSPVFVGKNTFDYLVEVADEATVRGLKPDHTALRRLPVRGVIVTARSQTPEFDFVSRFFAPAVGVDEDPVTGSAHCCLAPYWAAKLKKREMTGYQASPRGGTVRVQDNGERVRLAGHAVTVLRGELLSAPA